VKSRWSRRIALGIASGLTVTFAFVGIVDGPAGATGVISTTPTSATATTATVSTYTTTLVPTGNTGSVTYVETVNLPTSNQVLVSSSGVVTTSGNLAAGTYTVGGSDSDPGSADTGNWSFALTVSPVAITQTAPTTGITSTSASSGYTTTLAKTGNVGAVAYVETATPPASTHVLVSSSGVVTTSGTLAATTYTV
jgi:hypothetical protein